mgnify:CR=1 FL=1
MLEVLILAFALSMDAFAVSIGLGIKNKQDIKIMALKAGLFFGIFQALMPFLGLLGGIGLREYIQGYDKIVAFVLLLLIGGKMLYEAFTENIEEEIAQVTNKLLLTLAIATSLDAMAAGYSLHLFSVNVYLSIFIIINFIYALLIYLNTCHRFLFTIFITFFISFFICFPYIPTSTIFNFISKPIFKFHNSFYLA